MRRRRFLGLAAGAALAVPALARARAAVPFRLGLTPVFLDNDALVLERLRTALAEAMGGPISLIQRRTYQEITAAILDGSVDAAWICGFPFLQHRESLALLGVPVWHGRPLYQSYLIVRLEDDAEGLDDLRGAIHAFSDPDSNSGFLVTASDLARMGETPEHFFARTVFTYGHRNVVRAVAGGLTRSGSVDGYVWQALSVVEPQLTAGTRIVARSEWLGFPPFAARADRMADDDLRRFKTALVGLNGTEAGRAALEMLFLDAIAPGDVRLFDGIAARMAEIARR
ncbi:MAG: hypothetical protein Kow0058_07660 [Roseovarius sp.]